MPAFAIKKILRIYDHRDTLVPLISTDLYVQDDQPYGAQQLLGPDGAYAVGVAFLSSKYFEDPPEKRLSIDLSWRDWIHEYLGVRRHLRLVDDRTGLLSNQAEYIATHHPHEFTGYLKHVWPKEGKLLISSDAAVRRLRKTRVLCLNGKRLPLADTYLPLPELSDVCRRFTGGTDFPFLQLPDSGSDANLHSNWDFLINDLA
jgi:hypothetical protein